MEGTNWRSKLQPEAVETKSIGAEDTYSDWVFLRGQFNFSLSGTWVATVHLQRSFDAGVTPLDVDSFTANTEQIGEEPEGALYRFGVKTGNFTSDTVVGRLSS